MGRRGKRGAVGIKRLESPVRQDSGMGWVCLGAKTRAEAGRGDTDLLEMKDGRTNQRHARSSKAQQLKGNGGQLAKQGMWLVYLRIRAGLIGLVV
jgi:hypothetical protein